MTHLLAEDTMTSVPVVRFDSGFLAANVFIATVKVIPLATRAVGALVRAAVDFAFFADAGLNVAPAVRVAVSFEEAVELQEQASIISECCRKGTFEQFKG